jgi:hypothetical protein
MQQQKAIACPIVPSSDILSSYLDLRNGNGCWDFAKQHGEKVYEASDFMRATSRNSGSKRHRPGG